MENNVIKILKELIDIPEHRFITITSTKIRIRTI